MFRVLDVLLGFILLVLLASLAGMAITYAVAAILQLRGRHLRLGIAELLRRLDPNIPKSAAQRIAGAVLSSPVATGSGKSYVAVIFRDQLAKLLLEAAAGGEIRLAGEEREALRIILARNGISDAGQTLSEVERYAAKLAMSYTELSESERQNLALVAAAQSRFITVLNESFDRIMDRVSDRYSEKIRLVVFAVSLLLAVAVQFDAFAVLNRLSMEPETRTALLESAFKSQSPDGPDSVSRFYRWAAGNFGLFPAPGGWSLQDWLHGLSETNAAGILLSAILLALGAQFWYNALKNLLGLRSIAAAREAAERAMRQSPGPSQAISPPHPDVARTGAVADFER
jgi:hypothetical protein